MVRTSTKRSAKTNLRFVLPDTVNCWNVRIFVAYALLHLKDGVGIKQKK